MKITVLSEKYNPYLKRKEMSIAIEHESAATPSKEALQSFMAKEIKKEHEHIEIVNIFSTFGKSKSVSTIFVWDEKKVPDLSKKEEVKSE